jgi:dTDP-4-amino-4,6-dideoxygalactose transaminase
MTHVIKTKRKLAIHGGPATIAKPFPPYNPYGSEEIEAATAVIRTGVLSQYIGAWHADFLGGPKVRAFEGAWSDFFGVQHSVAVNSATSGLIAAVGAIGIEPGDEVIVSPWTMCASATAILVWNGIPVFADIDPQTFNLDVASIRRAITKRTRAIVVTDIFGHPADLDGIRSIAKEHKLKVIEDAAQAPAARHGNAYAGTTADIVVFSLNYHKHIHTGEGGMCVTNDQALAERMQLIRNHAEAVVAGKEVENISNMIGFNFRLGEIEAAMGLQQLKKLNHAAQAKTRAGARLTDGLKGLRGLATPVVKPDCTHVYYVYALVLDEKQIGVPRARLAQALAAEGVPGVLDGYINLHLLPMYQKRIAYGSRGYPWRSAGEDSPVSYAKGICPVAEHMHDRGMLGILTCAHDFSDDQVDVVIKAFHKVWDQLDELR